MRRLDKVYTNSCCRVDIESRFRLIVCLSYLRFFSDWTTDSRANNALFVRLNELINSN